MTREIKFRAWDKRVNQIREIWSIEFHDLPDSPCGQLIVEDENWVKGIDDESKNDECEGYVYYDLDDVILMQFTGLLDKNGKEIYEGDIIECINGDKPKAVIEFGDDKLIGIYLRRWIEDNLIMYLRKDDSDDLIVIGNIYENKDLLK